MTIVPISALTEGDLRLLGNNLAPKVHHRHKPVLDAVNRSLAVHQELVDKLYRRPVWAGIKSSHGSARRKDRTDA